MWRSECTQENITIVCFVNTPFIIVIDSQQIFLKGHFRGFFIYFFFLFSILYFSCSILLFLFCHQLFYFFLGWAGYVYFPPIFIKPIFTFLFQPTYQQLDRVYIFGIALSAACVVVIFFKLLLMFNYYFVFLFIYF